MLRGQEKIQPLIESSKSEVDEPPLSREQDSPPLGTPKPETSNGDGQETLHSPGLAPPTGNAPYRAFEGNHGAAPTGANSSFPVPTAVDQLGAIAVLSKIATASAIAARREFAVGPTAMVGHLLKPRKTRNVKARSESRNERDAAENVKRAAARQALGHRRKFVCPDCPDANPRSFTRIGALTRHRSTFHLINDDYTAKSRRLLPYTLPKYFCITVD